MTVTLNSGLRKGLTIVELLVAGFVLVVVLGAAAAFLAQQTQLQRSVQARNELQDRVRVSMQFVTQDLALVGNPVLIAANGTQVDPSPFLGCPGSSDLTLPPEERERARCMELESVSASSSILRMRYVSSQFDPAVSCRDVAYQLSNGVLERSDVPCLLGAWRDPVWIPIAPSAIAFKVFVLCSDGTPYEAVPTPTCRAPGGYSRSAIVSVAAESVTAIGTGAGGSGTIVGFGTTGLRNDVEQDCDDGRLCFSATAEVLMPNLKE